MTTLLDDLKNAQFSKRLVATRRYAEIIARYDKPEAGDGEELAAIMTTLGISADVVKNDLGLLRDIAANTARIVSGEEIGRLKIAADQAIEKHRAADDALKTANAARIAARNNMGAALHALDSAEGATSDAHYKIRQARAKSPRAFGLPSEVTT